MTARKRYKPLANAEAYKAVLSMLDETLPPRHRRMLESHYNAPRHTVTARSLAAAVGYPNFNSVNLQYGTLARKICEILGLRLEFHVSVLAVFVTP
ncbi:MAG: HNH endonuclease, partial [Acidobacteriota bacterium]